jgi:aminoglycoside N3'-acetyltransferase
MNSRSDSLFSELFSSTMARLTFYGQRWLPASSIGWLKGKRNEWRRRQRGRLRLRLTKKYGTFTADQLVRECRSLGVRQNGVLFVQCSYNDLLSFKGTAYELLNALRELVGPGGTLLMPAYTTNMDETPCRPFDVLQEPTYTGIVPELFRREKGVVRSLHPRHSICGLGPQAADLLAGHEDCVYADGLDSPFDRIRRMDAQSLCLGMRPGVNSFVHWVEDIEPEKYPVVAQEGPFDCVLQNASGKEIRRPFYRRPKCCINQEWLIGKHLGPNAMRTLEFQGVLICLYMWPALATELLALRDRGIVCFA